MDEKKIRKIFLFQQDQSDCGIACLLMLIKYYNGENTLEYLRNKSGTNISGTTLLGLQQAATQAGFSAEGCEASIKELISHHEPCILHVIINNHLHHYIVCFGTKSEQREIQFIIGDPSKGVLYLSIQELEQIWQSKICLTLTPNIKFRNRLRIGTEKHIWFKKLIKNDIHLLAIASLIGIVTAILGISMAIFSQKLIDDILPHKNLIKLITGLFLVLFLLVSKEGLSVIRQYFMLQQGKQFNLRITEFFYRQLLQLPKSFFDTRKIGDLTARLNDTNRIQKVIAQIAGNVLIDILTTVVTLLFLFTYSWKIGLICITALPVYFVLIYSHNKKIANGQCGIMVDYALNQSNYISTLQGVEPIKNFNKQKSFVSQNNKVYKNYQDKIFWLGKIQLRLSFMANGFAVVFLIINLFATSYWVFQGNFKTGQLMAVLGLTNSLLPSIANLALITIPISEAKIAFDRMFEFTCIETEDENLGNDLELFQSLTINNLSFRFAGNCQFLRNISFNVKSSEMIAIMGENGSGKSTFSQILQKYYEPENGEIIVNDSINLKEISFNSWRKIIGVIPQNIHIFNGTVLENIAFEDAVMNPQKVINFLHEYGFTTLIDVLPQSIRTLVGEEGINLSGGQKQIIAVARALYHKPSLLILDEATSAMDRQSEQFVLNLLRKLRKDIGIIFITHRLHILKNLCDHIYILENNTIATHGNHFQLLQEENLYSEYWRDLN